MYFYLKNIDNLENYKMKKKFYLHYILNSSKPFKFIFYIISDIFFNVIKKKKIIKYLVSTKTVCVLKLLNVTPEI